MEGYREVNCKVEGSTAVMGKESESVSAIYIRDDNLNYLTKEDAQMLLRIEYGRDGVDREHDVGHSERNGVLLGRH